MFAAAKKDGPVFAGNIADGLEFRAFMGSITEGLFVGFAAGAPEVGFTFLYLHGIGRFRGDYRTRHLFSSFLRHSGINKRKEPYDNLMKLANGSKHGLFFGASEAGRIEG